jgi:bile acid:Na+ symporter, BASS family
LEGALEIVARAAVLVFVIACMAAAGLGLGVRDVVAPLRRGRLVGLALAANFVVAPAVAWGLAAAFGLEQPYATGLILLGSAAGAPFLPKLAALARGDAAFAVGLMLLLTVGTAAFLPVALPVLTPGLSADPWPILRPILVTMLLPLGAAMFVRGCSGRWANRLRPAVGLVSNVGMVVAVVLLIGLNVRAMLDTFGSGAVAAAVVFVLAMLAVGYVLGGPAPTTRSVVGLGSGQRNIAAALTVVAGNADDPRVVIMLLVSTIVGLLALVPAARYLGRPASRVAAVAVPQEAAR